MVDRFHRAVCTAPAVTLDASETVVCPLKVSVNEPPRLLTVMSCSSETPTPPLVMVAMLATVGVKVTKMVWPPTVSVELLNVAVPPVYGIVPRIGPLAALSRNVRVPCGVPIEPTAVGATVTLKVAVWPRNDGDGAGVNCTLALSFWIGG